MEKGIEKGKIEVVKNLLTIGRFNTEEIASFASVTQTFVIGVQKTL